MWTSRQLWLFHIFIVFSWLRKKKTALNILLSTQFSRNFHWEYLLSSLSIGKIRTSKRRKQMPGLEPFFFCKILGTKETWVWNASTVFGWTQYLEGSNTNISKPEDWRPTLSLAKNWGFPLLVSYASYSRGNCQSLERFRIPFQYRVKQWFMSQRYVQKRPIFLDLSLLERR